MYNINGNKGPEAVEKCKYDQALFINFQQSHNNYFACGISPSFIMNEFCIPQLTEDITNEGKMKEVVKLEIMCLYHDPPYTRWDPNSTVTVAGCH